MHRQILVCVCSFAAVVVQRGSSVVLHNFTICSPLSPHHASLSFVFCFTTDAVGGSCFDFAWTHTHTHTNAHAHWFDGISVVCNTRICMAIMQLIELFHYAGGPVYGCVCVCGSGTRPFMCRTCHFSTFFHAVNKTIPRNKNS